VISYRDLLRIFWAEHRCNQNRGSRQYINAVFYRSDEQLEEVEESLAEHLEKSSLHRDRVETGIIPVRTFTYAEDYHQNYYLTQQRDLREFLTETYPTGKELADSHVATRLNAFLFNGFKRIENQDQFLEELNDYGLPEEISLNL